MCNKAFYKCNNIVLNAPLQLFAKFCFDFSYLLKIKGLNFHVNHLQLVLFIQYKKLETIECEPYLLHMFWWFIVRVPL